MELFAWIIVAVVSLVFIYLFVALLNPEIFS